MRRGITHPAWPALLLAFMLAACGDAEQPRPLFGIAGGDGASAGSAAVPAVHSTPLATPGGAWGLFGFEDAVAINFDAIYGCVAGLHEQPNMLCGNLGTQASEGRHLAFALRVTTLGEFYYLADVYQSEDGSRMAGKFATGQSPESMSWRNGYAWLPLPPTGTVVAGEVVRSLSHTGSRFEAPIESSGQMLLESDEGGLGELLEGVPYDWSLHSSPTLSVTGDLGAYWDSELLWDEATQTLWGGPVAATAPHLPIAFMLRFQDGKAAEGSVATAEGGLYHLVAAKPRLQ